MTKKSKLLLCGALLLSTLSFGQRLASTPKEESFASLDWADGVRIVIPSGVTINASSSNGKGSLVLNGNLIISGDCEISEELTVARKSNLEVGGKLIPHQTATFNENAKVTAGSFSADLKNGSTQKVTLKKGVQFETKGSTNINGGVFEIEQGASYINGGPIVVEKGATYSTHNDLSLSHKNNIIKGDLIVDGQLIFASTANTIECPGRIFTNSLVNGVSGTPIEGSGYIEVKNDFNGGERFTSSSPIVLNVLGNTKGNIGAATVGTEKKACIEQLPVEIISFDASQKAGTVLVSWTTETEINNNYFAVERSSDGINYKQLGIIKSKSPNGNSTNPLNYNFTDLEPKTGINYYRLKQVDTNGTVSYYNKTRSVTISKAEISLYPNPVMTTLHISGNYDKNATFIIYDAGGRQVLRSNNSSILVSTLAKGVYFVRAVSNNSAVTIGKFIKN